MKEAWRGTGKTEDAAAGGRKAHLAEVLAKLVDGWPVQKLDELIPWAWAARHRGATCP
jgi:hypothetical protein